MASRSSRNSFFIAHRPRDGKHKTVLKVKLKMFFKRQSSGSKTNAFKQIKWNKCNHNFHSPEMRCRFKTEKRKEITFDKAKKNSS